MLKELRFRIINRLVDIELKHAQDEINAVILTWESIEALQYELKTLGYNIQAVRFGIRTRSNHWHSDRKLRVIQAYHQRIKNVRKAVKVLIPERFRR